MTNWRARARLLAYACVAGLVLTGCGDDDGSGGQNDGGNGTSGQSGDGEELSPLEQYLGEDSGLGGSGGMTVAFSMADLGEDERQQMRQVEELVASCMQEAGFEYIPADPGGGEGGDDPFADAYSLPPDEFAREYGYGMTTLMDPGKETETEDTDPNKPIRDGLSEAALEQYNRALFGDTVEMSGGGAVAIAPGDGEQSAPQDQGCYGEASAEVYGDEGLMGDFDMSEFEGLFEDLDALRQRVESDPRMVEATEAWAACMAEAGYSEFDTTGQPEETVMNRMSELYGWDSESPTEPPSGEDDGEGDPSVTIGGGGEDIDEAALAELQEYEIAVATADYDCEQQEYAEVQKDVAWGFEEEFVDQHEAELERYRDAMAEGPAGSAGGIG
ncbi:hypothetical protein [Jiangella alba]|uniref:Uncharacterized protein n=1 Tax=Jiangella alba TaxID=561176 RepID=A0A1H5PPZ6_9ACTN|nr:hypothetical protein [Jiangella alba]SEF15866.1 hypothetical protein SAMN04488561_5109 [Jiangella alba]